MKIIRKIKVKTGDKKMVKKGDDKLSEDVLAKSSQYLKQVNDLLAGIKQEFEVGLKGGNFSPGYITEKTTAIARLAKMLVD